MADGLSGKRKRLFPYLKPPLERRARERNPITHIDSLSRTADILNVTDKTLYDNCFGLTQKFGELSDLLRTRDICDFSRRNN